MKTQFRKILLALFILTSFIIPNLISTANENPPLQKIAVIIDSTEFYDTSFINDIIKGFDFVNQTYNIDYEIFQLTNYTNIDNYPYEAVYYYNNAATNHTELAKEIAETQEYDLIALIGYELRHGLLDFSEHPDSNFLYYDLSGEVPSNLKKNDPFPENLLTVNFKENEIGYIAGALTTAIKAPLPSKIAIVGTYRGDPRSKQLIAGFQSAIFRSARDTQLLISYIDGYANDSVAKTVANDIKNEGYHELIFTGLQNNNSLGILEVLPNTSIISVDINRPQSILKNNTKVIMHLFNEFNQSGFVKGIYTFGLEDNVFYPSDWGDIDKVNTTMTNIYQDIVDGTVVVPTEIVTASNTSGFELFTTVIVILSISLSIRIHRKKRKV
ncbi:MAG: BMP family ABC transporter substrate-binding protein [Candidatus Hodarchaeota archaeon]